MRRTIRTRTIAALAVVAALAALGSGATTAGAASPGADLATYNSAAFLRTTLDLPVKPKLVIESVTYDRTQWLLKQPGKLAFLIGDPNTDPTFKARAQDVEAAADAAGVGRVYWFNPNLSGNAKVGTITEPNLDIRNPSGITSIAAAKRTIFGYAWLNLVGQYLGNGVIVDAQNQNTGSAKVIATVTTSGLPVNDYGSTPTFSTKVGNTSGGALYDYSSGSAPADVTDSFFFLYDKDRTVIDGSPKPGKIAAWTNLTDQADSTSAKAAVTSAINAVGAPNITEISEFAWWKSANNLWQSTSSPNEYQGALVPNLTDADGAAANGGWRVHQVTYPEYVYLLRTTTSKELVFLLGGTWCPNTRPVLPSINKYAQQNDATVINFDTILDGSVAGGGNSGNNPIQSRGPASVGGLPNANPSFIHGDVISQYLKNQKTEYTPDLPNAITYYPGGDTGQPLAKVARLQVPYLFAYKGREGDDPNGGITRQWLYDKGDGTYTEYMSVWWFTNPQPNQLGVTPANLPRTAPIWTKINTALATFTWQTDPEPLKPNSAIDTDAADFLTSTDRATVTFTPATAGGTPPASVSISAVTVGGVPIDPTALSSALSALGTLGGAPANNAAARTAFIAEKSAVTPDPAKVANLETVVGAWGVSQQRKTRVANIWGTPGTPGSVAGGAKALRAAEVFFADLPRKPEPPVVTPPAVTPPASQPLGASSAGGQTAPQAVKIKAGKVVGGVAKAPTRKARGRYRVKITTPSGGATPTGKVTITLRKGSVKKKVTGTLRNGVVTVSLPKLAPGTWKVAISWPGDAGYEPGSATGPSIKVKK